MAPVQMDAQQVHTSPANSKCSCSTMRHRYRGGKACSRCSTSGACASGLRRCRISKPRIQQGGDGFGLSIEEVRPCDDYQFHIRSEREYMGLQGTQIYCPKPSIEGLAEACNELDSFACLYASHHGRGYAQYAQVGREVCPTLFGRI